MRKTFLISMVFLMMTPALDAHDRRARLGSGIGYYPGFPLGWPGP